MLYSADPLAALVSDVLSDHDDQYSLLDTHIDEEWLLPETAAVESKTALYVVDKAVHDYEVLIQSLDLQASDELVLIDSDSGLNEISSAVLRHSELSELHIFTHSEGSGLRLGADVLDFNSAGENADLLGQWASALTVDADVMLYGCNLAATVEGIAFVDLLSQLTGADVAASTNLTGADEYNADWVLEYRSGEIETDIEQTTRSLSDWNGVLANIVVTTEMDVLDGNTDNIASLLANQGADGLISLREAIIAANNTAGADAITLAAPVPTYAISIATESSTADV